MGWWGKGPMEGDTPLDIECHIQDLLDELRPDIPATKKGMIKVLNEVQDELMARLRKEYKGDDKNMAMQVFGIIYMNAGIPINEVNKKHILTGIRRDDWAAMDHGRLVEMNKLYDTVLTYDNKPTKIDSKGLFEVIAEKIASGKKGLVNVTPGKK